MAVCFACGGTVIEYDAAAGNGFCVQCGTVVEENTIVSELTFGETSNGAAMVQGSYVAQGATRARMGGMYGNRGTGESREQTIANASRKIQNIAAVLRLSEVVCHAATRLYTLAVEHKFTKGRRSMNVVAICLYIACRQKETRNYMLIDFSDLLQVNVFELGHTYLQLVQTLNLRLPLVDPSHYISRFAALLEFGEDTARVATDAVRLVQRFDRDWLARGRRPAGICGAALLLAARMNGFRRSVAEIVQVVKIADTTLKKRLDEFRKTPSAQLKLADFRSVWLEDEMDPPAYTRGRELEERAREELEYGEKKEKKGQKSDRKKRRKRKRGTETDEEIGDAEPEAPAGVTVGPVQPTFDPALLHQGILAGTTEPLFLPDPEDLVMPLNALDADANIDPILLDPSVSSLSAPLITPLPTSLLEAVSDSSPPEVADDKDAEDVTLQDSPHDPLDDKADEAIADEVITFLGNKQGSQLAEALDSAEERRRARAEAEADVTWLKDLDDDELDRFILTKEEVKIKERVWVELNKDYLEAIAARGDVQEDTSHRNKSRKSWRIFLQRRKANNKPRDATDPTGSTAAESVRTLLKKNPKYSKRINYNALKGLFEDGGAEVEEDKDDGVIYGLSDADKSDGDTMVVDEDAREALPPSIPPISRKRSAQAQPDVVEELGGEYNDMESEKGDEYVAWDDPFEQEAF